MHITANNNIQLQTKHNKGEYRKKCIIHHLYNFKKDSTWLIKTFRHPSLMHNEVLQYGAAIY
jgi:hypothetical protein